MHCSLNLGGFLVIAMTFGLVLSLPLEDTSEEKDLPTIEPDDMNLDSEYTTIDSALSEDDLVSNDINSTTQEPSDEESMMLMEEVAISVERIDGNSVINRRKRDIVEKSIPREDYLYALPRSYMEREPKLITGISNDNEESTADSYEHAAMFESIEDNQTILIKNEVLDLFSTEESFTTEDPSENSTNGLIDQETSAEVENTSQEAMN